MDRFPEDLGLCPDLSRLPSNVLDLIQNGNRGEYPSRSEADMAVCATMFRAGYSVDEVWMVMTDPANGISEPFFEENGERAEVHLELLISEARHAGGKKGGKHKHVATSRGPPEDNVTKNAGNERSNT